MRRPLLIVLASLVALVALLPAGPARAAEAVKVSPGVYLVPVGADGGEHLAEREARSGGEADAGTPGAEPETRIVGGSMTTIEEWPWQAAIAEHPDNFVVPQDGFARQFCGGSLLAPTIVVSAAHCFYDTTPVVGGFTDPAGYTAITGRTVLSSEQGQEIPFADYHVFADAQGDPLYDPVTGEWDVVVIELAGQSASEPIKIAGPLEADLWVPGRPAFVTGWGTTSENGSGSDILRVAQIDMLADSTCETYWGSEYFEETMVCAGELEGGRDTCQGDSGGPLVVPTPAGEYRLVGDTSFGDGCARRGVPAVYGRLADDPMRSAIRNFVLGRTGVDVVGSPAAAPEPPSGPTAACLEARAEVKKLKRKLRKAKKAVRHKADKDRARKKVKRLRKKVRNARAEAAAACS